MPSVKIKSANFSHLVSEQVKARVLIDFASTPDQRQVLNRSFDTALEGAVDKLLEVTLPEAGLVAKQHYKETFGLVGNVLRQGLRLQDSIDAQGENVAVSFHPFTRKYYLQKFKQRPGTEELFWKFTGNMYKAYRQFAGARKSSTTRTKVVFHVLSRGYKYRGRVYRYQAEFTFPPIRQSEALDLIFRAAYITGGEGGPSLLDRSGLVGDASTKTHGMEILAYNELGNDSRSRPFITRLMTTRGRLLRQILVNRVEDKWGRGIKKYRLV